MILHFYFARKFLWTFLSIAGVFVAILALIDLVEELQDYPDLPFWDVFEVVMLNLPHANYEILPLVLILASVALFLRLARSSELVVVRASGRSAMRALSAPVITAAMIGIVSVLVFNPLVAASSKRYNDLVNQYNGFGSSALAITADGLWLRQGTASQQTVIHALSASSDLSTLKETTFTTFTPTGEPIQRIYAKSAQLGRGEWVLNDVKLWDLERGY